MKQFLLLILLFCFTITYSQQNIGFLGDFNGWGNDIDMTSSDNITFTKNNYYLPTGDVKFREGNNWGGSQWPGSGNYYVTSSGFYDISLDTSNGNISLVPSGNSSNQNISLIGDFNGWTDTAMTTTDNITYTLVGVTITTGSVKFRRDSGWECNWGDNIAADGTADPNSGDNIVIASDNTYDVTFNLSDLSYSFSESSTASVDNLLLKDHVYVYYNHSTKSTIIDVKLEIKNLEYQVYSVNGKMIERGYLQQGPNFLINDVSLPKGFYLIDIRNTSTLDRIVKKVIKN